MEEILIFMVLYDFSLILGVFNNMWKYDLTLNTWTRLYGHLFQNIKSKYNYGPRPGSVVFHSMTIDHADRFIYFFGGIGYDDDTLGRYL